MVAGRRGSEGRIVPVSPGLTSPLVIDESLNSRIATDLKLRGRDAVSVGELKLRGLQTRNYCFASSGSIQTASS